MTGRSQQAFNDFRYLVDFLHDNFPGLVYTVTKLDQITPHGVVHNAYMWGGFGVEAYGSWPVNDNTG